MNDRLFFQLTILIKFIIQIDHQYFRQDLLEQIVDILEVIVKSGAIDHRFFGYVFHSDIAEFFCFRKFDESIHDQFAREQYPGICLWLIHFIASYFLNRFANLSYNQQNQRIIGVVAFHYGL
ncbi:hypothetical protein SDC9_182755 [bioreactor metagenome]|uniref:Uncharacterized protein n=1 Tax=bioreactor metagenome TaxID=1076179 RepID=A0A645H8F1_9ZZZZ